LLSDVRKSLFLADTSSSAKTKSFSSLSSGFLVMSPNTPKHSTQHTHTRLTALFSGTTQVSRYQKGKTNLDFTEARDSEWQWHQLGRMQICTSLQTENHASNPPLIFYRPDTLPAT